MWRFSPPPNAAAGRFTDNLPGAEALHLPLATERKAFGILAVGFPDKHLTLAQRDLLETFARPVKWSFVFRIHAVFEFRRYFILVKKNIFTVALNNVSDTA